MPEDLNAKIKKEGLNMASLCAAYEKDSSRNPITGRKITPHSDIHTFFKKCKNEKRKTRSDSDSPLSSPIQINGPVRGHNKVVSPVSQSSINDKERGVELLRLQAEYAKLAEDFHVHKNTVDTRLSKLAEIDDVSNANINFLKKDNKLAIAKLDEFKNQLYEYKTANTNAIKSANAHAMLSIDSLKKDVKSITAKLEAYANANAKAKPDIDDSHALNALKIDVKDVFGQLDSIKKYISNIPDISDIPDISMLNALKKDVKANTSKIETVNGDMLSYQSLLQDMLNDISKLERTFGKDVQKLRDDYVPMTYFYEYTKYLQELARVYGMETNTTLLGKKIAPSVPMSPKTIQKAARAAAEEANKVRAAREAADRAREAKEKAEREAAERQKAEEAQKAKAANEKNVNLSTLQSYYLERFDAFVAANPVDQNIRKFVLLNYHPDKFPKEIKLILKNDSSFSRYVTDVFTQLHDRSELSRARLLSILNNSTSSLSGGRSSKAKQSRAKRTNSK